MKTIKKVNFLEIVLWLWRALGPWWITLGLLVAVLAVSTGPAIVLMCTLASISLIIVIVKDKDLVSEELNKIKNHFIMWWESKPTLLKQLKEDMEDEL